MVDADEIVYRIDGNDRIIFLNDAWKAFAAANGGNDLIQDGVLNRCLWDFMNDPETLYLHRTLVKRLRDGHSIRDLAFRCDSSAQRRFMMMDL